MRKESSRARGVALVAALCVQFGCAANGQQGTTFQATKLEANSKPLSPELAGAIALYEKGDYINSTLILSKVMEGASTAEKQQAEFTMAKALYRIGMTAAAFDHFEKIAGQGVDHRYYLASLTWLAAVLVELPVDSELQQVLDLYPVSTVDDPTMEPVRDDLRILFGQRLYQASKLTAAAKQFAAVSKKSQRYPRARVLEGVTHVRSRRASAARAAFKAARHATRDDGGTYIDGKRLHRLATLQQARVAYSVSDFDEAIELYDSLPQYSSEWLDGLFEASWAHLLGNTRRAKALGNIRSLGSRYVDPNRYPEAIVLEALIYFERCQYPKAISTAKRSRRSFRPQRHSIKQLIRIEVDADLYVKARAEANSPGTIHRAIDDRAIARAFAWVDAIEEQIDRAGAQDPAWTTTDVGIDTQQRLALRMSFAQAEAGRMIRVRLERSERELQRLSNDASRIEIESLERLADGKKTQLLGKNSTPSGKLESVPTDDEHYIWRFDDADDLWADEVGSIYEPLRNMCPEKTARR